MVGVVGVDGQARDRHACEEVAADVRPGEPAVHRLEDAIAKVAVAGQGAFTGAVVDDHVVGRGHNERARRQRWEVVGPVRPQLGVGVVGPDAPLGRAQDELAVLSDRQRADAAADRDQGIVAAGDLLDRAGADGVPGSREGSRAGRGRGFQDLRLFGRRLAQRTGLLEAQLVLTITRRVFGHELFVQEKELGCRLLTQLGVD